MAKRDATAAAVRGRGRPSIGRAKRLRRDALYGGMFEDAVVELDRRIRELREVHGDDRGGKLVDDLASLLRSFLPLQVGVCRGRVVDTTGRRRGAGLVVYDGRQLPGLRLLTENAVADVPAEAVLAYVEVRPSIAIGPRRLDPRGHALGKACRKVAAVKRLERVPVPLEHLTARLRLPQRSIAQRPGFPPLRNPWYAAIWAVDIEREAAARNPAASMARTVAGLGIKEEELPDVLAAGSVLMVPAYRTEHGCEPRPFVTRDTDLVFTNGMKAIAAAIFHLVWALEDLLPAELPWRRLLQEQLVAGDSAGGSVSLESESTDALG